MKYSFVGLLVEILILGFVAWLVDLAPFINPTFKTFITYALIVIAAVLLIGFLIGIVHGDNVFLTN